ncbi:hypothetical protein EJB05_14726, partial [Eragrostis curvula]
MLHYVIPASNKEDQIAAIDVQGKTQRIIPVPLMADGEQGWCHSSPAQLWDPVELHPRGSEIGL